jgi:enoyl-CoA hydratase
MSVPVRSIGIAVADHVATLTLGVAPVSNLDPPFFRDLGVMCDELAGDDDVHAVVLAGSGEHWPSTRADAGEAGARTPALEDRGLQLELECRAFYQLAALPHPTVAAIRGDAFGGGFELALACDFRIAGRSARLGLPDVTLGVFPAGGGLARLPMIVGDSTAKRLAILGDVIGAREARELRLVDDVVPDETVLRRATDLARRLADRSPAAARAIKRILAAQRELSHEEALRLILETALSRDVSDGRPRPGERRAESKRA